MDERQAEVLAATIRHQIHVTPSLLQLFGSDPKIRIEPSTQKGDKEEPTKSSNFFVTVIPDDNKLAAAASHPSDHTSSRSFSAPADWERFLREITFVERERAPGISKLSRGLVCLACPVRNVPAGSLRKK